MSWFGNGSFKQDLLNEIETLIETHGMKKPESVSEIAEVFAHTPTALHNSGIVMLRVCAARATAIRRLVFADIQTARGSYA